MKPHTLKWFKDRISKRLFRDPTDPPCPCPHCKDTEENGLIVFDDFHAQYLYDCQNDLEIIYRDKK